MFRWLAAWVPGVALCLVLFAGLTPGSVRGAETAPETAGAPAPDAAAAGTEEEEPAPPRFLSARLEVSEYDGDQVTTKRYKIHKLGNRVRQEPEESEDSRFEAMSLFDYDQALIYRHLADDDIVFAYRIATLDRVRAQIHGLMTPPEETSVWRLEVNPSVTFDGHPCTLVLSGFSARGRIHALHWVWEARDLDGAPVRVVLMRADGVLEVVEYLDATNEPFDEALVTLPEGVPVRTGL